MAVKRSIIEPVKNGCRLSQLCREENSSHDAVQATAACNTPMAEVRRQENVKLEAQRQSEIAITVRGFNAYYGDHQVLKDVNLEIAEKQVQALIGASGCGKSTLIKWINRMNDLVPSARAEGVLQCSEQNLLSPQIDVVDLRRRVGMVFQKPNPFPKSIFENVAFGVRLHYKPGRAQMGELVEWALQKAALWDEVKDRLHHSALRLSGGQQQRLCVARAIAVGPEVLLMDEPCSALDPSSTSRIEELIFELAKQLTVVIVTHNMQQAARCSDRTAFFFEGRILEEGETEQIFTAPRNQKTEEYVTGKFG